MQPPVVAAEAEGGNGFVIDEGHRRVKQAIAAGLELRRLAGETFAMTLPPELRRQLSRMEEARRQTQRQLDMVDRQITRRMTALIPSLLP